MAGIINAIVSGCKTFGKTTVHIAKSKSPVVLAGTAVVGAVFVAVTTFKCTPKYQQAVQAARTYQPLPPIDETRQGAVLVAAEPVEPTRKEKAKIFVRTMWPVMVSLIVCIASIITSHKLQARRIAVWSAAYTAATQKAAESAEKKAEEFIRQRIGDDAAKEYKQEAEQERTEVAETISTNSASYGGKVIETGGGELRFMDYYSGQAFKASYGYIDAKLELLNEQLRHEGESCISYSDVLTFLGLNSFGLGNSNYFILDGEHSDWPLTVRYMPGKDADGVTCDVMIFDHRPMPLDV